MTKPFWDVEESVGFVSILSPLDSLEYKVWDTGSDSDKLEAANILARVRKDINKLLIYLAKHPDLWMNKSIAYGVMHTFDIHIPCLIKLLDFINVDSVNVLNDKIIRKCVEDSTLFNYQEMTPNTYGIIGLNKPKIIKTIKVEVNGKQVDYEIAEKRSIFLTLRNYKTNVFNDYTKILNLAIHELTHTTCNDVRWKPDNHMYPYPRYHSLMRKWAKDAGIIN